MRDESFQETQDRHFGAADAAHFRWTTRDPAFAPAEDALLAPWIADLEPPCLEIGCGEGTNLMRLVRRGTTIGIDRHVEKVRFAARAVAGARVAAADASALPFRDGAFASVFVRDLLHHLADPALAAAEAVRVLAPGGVLVILEPNGRNPFVALQARLVAAERALSTFTPESVLAAVAGLPLREVTTTMAEGFPLRRLVCHYRLGLPALGRWRAAAALLRAVERTGARLLPRSRWAYTAVRARRAHGS